MIGCGIAVFVFEKYNDKEIEAFALELVFLIWCFCTVRLFQFMDFCIICAKIDMNIIIQHIVVKEEYSAMLSYGF
jgi:hypothetical protein